MEKAKILNGNGMNRVIVIGDLHGRDLWKKVLFGNNQNFELWRNEYDLGIHKESHYHIDDYDEVVFIGDYTDSFKIMNVEILHNLKEIILVKNTYPHKVHLLIGNHDLQYIYNQQRFICSGYRSEMAYDLHQEFKNADFELAYQIDNILFTHAGIINKWSDLYLNTLPEKYTRFFQGNETIAEKLNILYQCNYEPLFDVGFLRRGYLPFGGPLWADKTEMEEDYLKGYLNIVGHTATDKIEMNINGDEGVIFIDTCDVGQFLILEIFNGKIDFDFLYL